MVLQILQEVVEMAKLELKTKKQSKVKEDGQPFFIRRPLAFMVRFTQAERDEVKRLARAANVTISEYIRCKAFDIPFEHVGGRQPGPSLIGGNGELASKNGKAAKN
jgi:hypothetical protein